MSQDEKPAAAPPGGRTQPWNQEAEESVVGGILLYSKAFLNVAEIITPDDFYHPALKAIYRAMIELDEAGKPIDSITVAEQMRANDTFGRLRAFNGESYFAELMSKVVTVENIGYHAKIVRGKATVRRLIEAAQEVAARGYGEYGDVDEFLAQAEEEIRKVGDRSAQGGPAVLKTILRGNIKALEKRFEAKQVITGVPSGYNKLDAMTAGFQPGELIIIAARPSMGKTSLVMNAVQKAAIEFGIPALVFSLEMSKESLVDRLLASDSRVDSGKIRNGFGLTQRDWINITKAANRIHDAPIWIDDTGAPTLLDIRAKARRWRSDSRVFKSKDQHGIVVIDYLQLVHGPSASSGRENNREREISEISRGLKGLAKELRVPVIALSQLNRSVESRRDKRPQLSDLRESGAIEQDADLIAFIYRDEMYNKESPDKGIAEVIIGKQRNGQTDTVRLAFIQQYTTFCNLAEDA